MARRARGTLEHEVLAALWAGGVPMTPEDVRTALGSDLAYTTVLTILVRLHEKRVVDRATHGRGYAYVPLLTKADIAARQMAEVLDAEPSRGDVLSRFAEALSADDVAALRAALRRGGRR